MGLSEVTSAMQDRLKLIPGIVYAPDAPPNTLQNELTLIVYPSPGEVTPHSHRGKNGPVYQATDIVVIEWYARQAADQTEYVIKVVTPMLDTVRQAVMDWVLMDGYGNRVSWISSVGTEAFGQLEYGEDCLGFRLLANVVHHFEGLDGSS